MVKVGCIGRTDDNDVTVANGFEEETVGDLGGCTHKCVSEKVDNSLGSSGVGGEEDESTLDLTPVVPLSWLLAVECALDGNLEGLKDRVWSSAGEPLGNEASFLGGCTCHCLTNWLVSNGLSSGNHTRELMEASSWEREREGESAHQT